jgi:PPM family protein phosphatase
MLADSDATRCVGPLTGRIRLAREPPHAPGASDHGGLVVEFAQRTTGGPLHAGNEDAICCWSSDQEVLFAVADGVGGHEDGAVASATALAAVLRTWEGEQGLAPLKRLRRAVERANLAVYDAGHGRMRTTLTISVLGPETLTAAHVGDSRLLLFRDGTLRQLTTDHNLAARSAQYGLPSLTELPDDPGRRLLTRALGQDPYLRIDTFFLPLQRGDRFIQCSDGLATLSGAHMIRILVHHDPIPAAERLLHDALQAGGSDDMSVQVVRVSAAQALGPAAGYAAEGAALTG